MANTIPPRPVQNPQIIDFINMTGSQNNFWQDNNLQLDRQGRLYVSKQHGSVASFCAKIVAKLENLFGTCRFEASIGLADTERAAAAAVRFKGLVNELGEDNADRLLANRDLASIRSYKNLLSDCSTAKNPFLQQLNNYLASEFKIDQNSLSGKKAYQILSRSGLKLKPMAAEDKSSFVQIYNLIVEDAVLTAGAPIDEETITTAVKNNTALLAPLTKKPGLAKRVTDYNQAFHSCLNDMYKASGEMDSGKLARETMNLICIHNDFVHDKAQRMGIDQEPSEAKMLQKLAVIHSRSGMKALGCEEADLAKFFRCIAKPGISVVFQKADEAIELFYRESTYVMDNQEKFDEYQRQSKITSSAKLVDKEPLNYLKEICDDLQPASVSIAQKAGKDVSKGPADLGASALNGVKKFLDGRNNA